MPVNELPVPEFFARDVNDIVADMIAYFEFTTGRTLAPGDPERLVINMFAYRELVLRNANNDAACQNLIQFSRYPVIDYLGQLVGVTRLPAASAATTLQFTLVAGHGAVVIPEGTRVSTVDGSLIFETTDNIVCVTGTDIYTIEGLSQAGGASGNGYLNDTVTVLIDVLPFVDLVTNLDATNSGSDEETDDQLRERVKLAPNAFSVAGPRDAYKYFAFTAHPTIIDVAVTNPVPGVVNIYPLSTAGVPTPSPILQAVQDFCNGEKIRPICDTVIVLSPVAVPYDIEVELTLYNYADQQFVESTANEASTTYSTDRGKKLGRDIIRAQILALYGIDGVYNVNLIQPASDIILSDEEFGEIGTISIIVVGFNNG